ncbi:DUF6794 domain-containing protein [Limnoglobus roseus]|uniref:DUF6794 domain-containing protein n=1 Tax=Limnoglobus roseus TaxID=2598579 RepID=A0A5C1AKA4_9BACT|nr:hypothetical protein [Limnoglobus roseus]QEL17584.1 hypothetical protein PX52LOC_04580 [Limnoglobus roseus]
MTPTNESPLFGRLNQWRARPVSVTEAADAIDAGLAPAERTALRVCPFKFLSQFDYTLGVVIRNRLGLWNEGRMVDVDGQLVTCPDMAAQLVIEELWFRERQQQVAPDPVAVKASVVAAMRSTLGTGLHVTRPAGSRF